MIKEKEGSEDEILVEDVWALRILIAPSPSVVCLCACMLNVCESSRACDRSVCMISTSKVPEWTDNHTDGKKMFIHCTIFFPDAPKFIETPSGLRSGFIRRPTLVFYDLPLSG